jgi:homoserine kinase
MRETFTREPVRVVVPASSANLGPGFDCLGMALARYDELVAMVSDDDGILIEVAGEAADEVPRDESHLVVRGMRLMFDHVGAHPPGFILRCRNSIPHSRGLGSSAAAIMGGLALARALIHGGVERFSDNDLLTLAMPLESHPDNLSAALLGGFTVGWVRNGKASAVRMPVHADIRPVVAIPPHRMATFTARQALPAQVELGDVIFNLSRTGLMAHAMRDRPDLLLDATADALHQRARASIYPGSMDLVNLLRARGFPALVCGAGPSVLVLGYEGAHSVEAVAAHAPSGWDVLSVPISPSGATIVPLHP